MKLGAFGWILKYIIQHVCRPKMARISMPRILLLALLTLMVVGVRIEKGFLTLDVATGESS